MTALVLPSQSTFTFGKKSEAELSASVLDGQPLEPPVHVGVHPKLQCVTRLALAISLVDFGIHDGIRTEEEHAADLANGTSRIDRSKHQDGLAIDAVAWVKGAWTWAPAQCWRVAKAHQQASRFLRIPIIWGGCFDRTLGELGASLEMEHTVYVERFKLRNAGKEPLIDLVHFQLAGEVNT